MNSLEVKFFAVLVDRTSEFVALVPPRSITGKRHQSLLRPLQGHARMSHRRPSKFLFSLATWALTLIFACQVPVASAEIQTSTLEIRDTSGVTRNVSDVETAGDVEFSLEDQSGMPAQGAEVTLTNEATGEVLRAVSANGVVKITGVAPGTWVVASTTPGITFTSVTVLSATAVAGSFGGTAILGMNIPTAIGAGLGTAAAVAGGTVAIVHATDGDSDNDDDVMSPIL